MSLSSAIDMFLHQAVKENRFPCSLDSKIVSAKIQDMTSTYPVGPNDLLIAATVLANNGTLITHNTKEFSRIEDLRVEDWTE